MKRVIIAAVVAALSFVGFADVTEPIPSPEPGIPLNVRTGLPPEIRQMTMLVGEGSQYIVTEVTPTQTTVTECAFGKATKTGNTTILSQNFDDKQYLLSGGSGFTFWGGGSTKALGSNDGTSDYFFRMSPTGESGKCDLVMSNVTAQTVTMVSPASISFTSTDKLAVFGTVQGKFLGSYVLYSLKLAEGEDLLGDFVPAYSLAEHAAGLYDFKKQKFYPSKSETAFQRQDFLMDVGLALVNGRFQVTMPKSDVPRTVVLCSGAEYVGTEGWTTESDPKTVAADATSVGFDKPEGWGSTALYVRVKVQEGGSTFWSKTIAWRPAAQLGIEELSLVDSAYGSSVIKANVTGIGLSASVATLTFDYGTASNALSRTASVQVTGAGEWILTLVPLAAGERYYVRATLANDTDEPFTSEIFDFVQPVVDERGTPVGCRAGLPFGYVQMTKLVSTGSQKIDTLIKPTAATGAELSFGKVVSGDSALFSQAFANKTFSLAIHQKYYRYFGANNGDVVLAPQGENTVDYLFTVAPTANNQCRVTFVNTTAGTSLYDDEKDISLGNSSNNIYVFGQGNMSSCSLYSFKITEGGELVADFVPAYEKSTGLAGLYDLKRQGFYPSSTTTAFVQQELLEFPPLEFADGKLTMALPASTDANRTVVLCSGATYGSVDAWTTTAEAVTVGTDATTVTLEKPDGWGRSVWYARAKIVENGETYWSKTLIAEPPAPLGMDRQLSKASSAFGSSDIAATVTGIGTTASEATLLFKYGSTSNCADGTVQVTVTDAGAWRGTIPHVIAGTHCYVQATLANGVDDPVTSDVYDFVQPEIEEEGCAPTLLYANQSALIGHWDGFENAGRGVGDASATTWADLTGITGDLTVNSVATFNAADGCLVRENASVVGSDSRMAYSTNAAGVTAWNTIEIVLRRTDFATHAVVFSPNGHTDGFLAIKNSNAGSNFSKYFTVSDKFAKQGELATLTLVHDGSAWRLYQDGVSCVQNSESEGYGSGTSTALQIGGRATNTSNYLRGRVYAVRLYSSVLSADAIAANAELDNARFVEKASCGVSLEFRDGRLEATIPASASEGGRTAVLCWGEAYAGVGTWEHESGEPVEIPAGATTVSFDLPEGWGKTVWFARAKIGEGESAVWSKTTMPAPPAPLGMDAVLSCVETAFATAEIAANVTGIGTTADKATLTFRYGTSSNALDCTQTVTDITVAGTCGIWIPHLKNGDHVFVQATLTNDKGDTPVETDVLDYVFDGEGYGTLVPLPADRLPPAGYAFVPSVYLDGSTYLITDVYPSRSTRAVVSYMSRDSSHDKMIFGERKGSSQYPFLLWCGNTSGMLLSPICGSSNATALPNGVSGNTIIHYGDVVTVDFGFGGVYYSVNGGEMVVLDSAETVAAQATDKTSTLPLYLFGLNEGGSVESRKYFGNCYWFKLYEGDELVHDYVPMRELTGEKRVVLWDFAKGEASLPTVGAYTVGEGVTQVVARVESEPLDVDGVSPASGTYLAEQGVVYRFTAPAEVSLGEATCTLTGYTVYETGDSGEEAVADSGATNEVIWTVARDFRLVWHWEISGPLAFATAPAVVSSEFGSSVVEIGVAGIGDADAATLTFHYGAEEGVTDGSVSVQVSEAGVYRATLPHLTGGLAYHVQATLDNDEDDPVTSASVSFVQPAIAEEGVSAGVRDMPEGYAQMEKLTSTGREYVLINYWKPDNKTSSEVELGEFATISSDFSLFGQAYDKNQYLMTIQSSVFKWYGSGAEVSSDKLSAGETKYQFKIEALGTGNGDVTVLNRSSGKSSQLANNTLAVGGGDFAVFSDSANKHPASYSLYSFKAWKNGEISIDLVPAYEIATEKAGLLDLVTGEFRASATATPFATQPFALSAALKSVDGRLEVRVAKASFDQAVTLCWGAAYAGTEAWGGESAAVTISAGSTTETFDFPDGWGDTVFFVRAKTAANGDEGWSNTIVWRPEPSVGVGEDLSLVSSAFGSSEIAAEVTGIGRTATGATLAFRYGTTPTCSDGVVQVEVSGAGEWRGTLPYLQGGQDYYVMAALTNSLNEGAESAVFKFTQPEIAEAGLGVGGEIVESRNSTITWTENWQKLFDLGDQVVKGGWANVTIGQGHMQSGSINGDADKGRNLRPQADGTLQFQYIYEASDFLKVGKGALKVEAGAVYGKQIGSYYTPTGTYTIDEADVDDPNQTYTSYGTASYTITRFTCEFRAACELTKTADGLVLQIAAAADDRTVALFAAKTYCDTNDWGTAVETKTLGADEATIGFGLPDDWGEETFFARVRIGEGAGAVWSPTVIWQDTNIPAVTLDSADGLGGDTMVLKGTVDSVGGANCTLRVRVGANADELDVLWDGLEDSSFTEPGEFELTLFGSDTSAAKYLTPGETYFVAVEAVGANGRTAWSAIREVRMADAPDFALPVAAPTFDKRKMTVKASLTDTGVRGTSVVELWVGESADSLEKKDFLEVKSAGETFQFTCELPEFEKDYYWQLRAIGETTGGTQSYDVRTDAAKTVAADKATYTWSGKAGDGKWSTAANWSDNMGGDCLHYPQSASATAVINKSATITVDVNVTIKELNYGGVTGIALTLVAANATDCGLTGNLVVPPANSHVTLDGLTFVKPNNAWTATTDSTFELRNGANFTMSQGIYFYSEEKGKTDVATATLLLSGKSTMSVNWLYMSRHAFVEIDDSTLNVTGGYNVQLAYNTPGDTFMRFKGAAPKLVTSKEFRVNTAGYDATVEFVVPEGGWTEAPITAGGGFNTSGAANLTVRVSDESPAARVNATAENVPLVQGKVGKAKVDLVGTTDPAVTTTFVWGDETTTPLSLGVTIVGSAHNNRLTVANEPVDVPGDVSGFSPKCGDIDGEASVALAAPATFEFAGGLRRATCTGWKLYDVDPATQEPTGEAVESGTENEYAWTSANKWQRFVWQWRVEEKVVVTPVAGGSVTASSDWTGEGTPPTLTATPDAGMTFAGWTGDVTGAEQFENPLQLVDNGSPRSIAATFIAGTTPTATNSVADLDFSDFKYHTYITFDGYDGAAALANFPALIRLTEGKGGFSYNECEQSNGGDVRFTLGDGRELASEVVTWNTSGTSEIWVNVPSLTKDTRIMMFWGNASAPARPLELKPFASDYKLVYEMDATGATAQDSGLSGAHGFLTPTVASVPGVVGMARSFDKTKSERVVMPLPFVRDVFQPNKVGTWELWFKCPEGSTKMPLFSMDTHNWNSGFLIDVNGNGLIETYIFGGNNITTEVALDVWHHLAVEVDPVNGPFRFYVDGELIGEKSQKGWFGNVPGFYLAYSYDNSWGTYYTGELDEVRVSAGLRGRDYPRAVYRNVVANGDFMSFDSAPERRLELKTADRDLGDSSESCRYLPTSTAHVFADGVEVAADEVPATAKQVVKRVGVVRQYRVTVAAGAGGSVEPALDGAWVDDGTILDVTATATDDSKAFHSWGGNCPTLEVFTASMKLPVDRARTVSAVFAPCTEIVGGTDGETAQAAGAAVAQAVSSASADAPSVVLLGEGLYQLPAGSSPCVVVAKPVVFRSVDGIGKAVIDCEPNQSKIPLQLNHVGAAVDGFAFTNAVSGSGWNLHGSCLSVQNGHALNCIFENNTINLSNGSLLDLAANVNSACWVKRCVFRNNKGNTGGDNVGVAATMRANGGLVDSCVFTNNLGRSGSGLTASYAIVRNCLFAANDSTHKSISKGGALNSSGNTVVENCTFMDNHSGYQGGAVWGEAILVNCAFGGNSVEQSSNGPDWYDSTVTRLVGSLSKNFRADELVGGNKVGQPVVRDKAAGDYRPTGVSPTTDLGFYTPSGYELGATDLSGAPRLYNRLVDSGCYEYTPGEQEEFAVNVTADVQNGVDELIVTFTSLVTGADDVSYSWNFGDGGTSTEANPVHTYIRAGYFDVTLTVTDNKTGDSIDFMDGEKMITVLPSVCYVREAGTVTSEKPFATPETAATNIYDAFLIGPSVIDIGEGEIDPGATISFEHPITLRGKGPDKTFVNMKSGRVFHIKHAGDVFADLTIYNGQKDWNVSMVNVSALALITNCVIRNYKSSNQPAVDLCPGRLVDCVVCNGSHSSSDGSQPGGVWVRGSGSEVINCVITNCTLVSVVAKGVGVSVRDVPSGGKAALIRNTLIADNRNTCKNEASTAAGIGLYLGGPAIVENCTIADNVTDYGTNAGVYVASANVRIVNTVASGNFIGTAEEHEAADFGVLDAVTDCEPDHSFLSGDAIFNRGARKSEPYWGLRGTSPCKNRGVKLDWMTPEAKDLNGQKRVFNAKPDIGCYESQVGGTVIIVR